MSANDISSDLLTIEQAKSQLLKQAFGDDNLKQVESLRTEFAKSNFEARKALVETQAKIFEQRKEVTKGIKQFWVQTLKKSPLVNYFEEKDEDALASLEDISITFSPSDPREYSIAFTFSSNPYFSDSTLTKVYKLPKEIKEANPYDLDAPAFGEKVEINWKDEEHNLNKKYPRPDMSKAEEYSDFESLGSFFHFFEETEGEIGVTLLQVWENALDVFSGVAALEAGEEDSDMDSDDEEDESDGAEEVDLGDSETDMPKKKKQKK